MADANPSLSQETNAGETKEQKKAAKPRVKEVTTPSELKPDAVDPSERFKPLQEGEPGNPNYRKIQLRTGTIKEVR